MHLSTRLCAIYSYVSSIIIYKTNQCSNFTNADWSVVFFNGFFLQTSILQMSLDAIITFYISTQVALYFIINVWFILDKRFVFCRLIKSSFVSYSRCSFPIVFVTLNNHINSHNIHYFANIFYCLPPISSVYINFACNSNSIEVIWILFSMATVYIKLDINYYILHSPPHFQLLSFNICIKFVVTI